MLAGERRVAVLPDTVKKLVQSGFSVGVEAGAGLGSLADDDAYRTAGAEVFTDVLALYDKADLVLKVKQPHYNSIVGEEEARLFKPGSVLVTFLHPAAPSNHDQCGPSRAQHQPPFTMDGVPAPPVRR